GDLITQHAFYHEGVGTGPLDRITGGGFGFGLEANVRAAYDWLVPQYHDGDEGYVFGFSRGASTARSLGRFIATCRPLRRSAPLTVSELWENYCLLGRAREQRQGVWDTVFPEAPTFRKITDLVWDPWLVDDRAQPSSLQDSAVPGQRAQPRNETERLLI